MTESYKDKFIGSMVGLAIGDALGMPCEDYEQPDLLKTFGRITDYLDPPKGQFNYDKLKAGMYTDDTEQAIVLAESLVENNGLDVNHFAKKLLGEYGRNVVEHRELDRWIGSTFKKAVNNYVSGMLPDKCGVKAKSCGSAMRVAPIGLVYWDALDNVARNAAKSSRVTHLGAGPIAASEAVALYVTLATRGTYSTKEMSDIVTEMVGRKSKIIAKKVKKAYEIRNEKPKKVIKIFGNSQLARETVPLAIYSFHHNPYDFEDAVLTSVNAGGDTDSIAAITGAINGAFKGLHGIPRRWVERIENKDKLISIGERLYEAARKQTEIRLHKN